MLNLCRAIVNFANEGHVISAVYELEPDGTSKRVAYRGLPEYQEALKDPEPDVIVAKFATNFSSGASFASQCRVNQKSREVFDIEASGTPSDNDDISERLVSLDDGEHWHQVHCIDDILDEYDDDIDNEAFADIENIEYQNVDTSQVTSAASAFSGMKKLTSIGGLENWNTSNITTMNRMCYQCEALQSIAGMEKWDTSKVTDMSEAFAGCLSLSDASPTDGWDTSSVTNKENMFAGALCEKAPEIANDTENTDTDADSSEGNSEQAESKAKNKEDEVETKTPDSENTQPDTSTAA